MAARSPVGRDDDGWTRRGKLTVGLLAVLGVVLVLSHFGVPTAVLFWVAAVAVLVAVIAFHRLPRDANDREGDSNV